MGLFDYVVRLALLLICCDLPNWNLKKGSFKKDKNGLEIWDFFGTKYFIR